VPPLRGESDRQAIVEGLKSGIIDAIVSDHRPQDQDSKRVPFAQAEAGGIGLETLLPVSLELVHNGHLTLPHLFQRLASTPARLFNLPGGKLAKGGPADLVIFDQNLAWKVDRADIWSKTKNSPFDERPVQGKVMATIVGGRTIYRDDHFAAAIAA
jgi:dihydroorotase